MRSWRAYLGALAGVIGIVLLGLAGIWRSIEDASTDQPRASATAGELLPPVVVGQTFVAEYAGLSRIEVRLATYARSNTGPLVFHLRAHPDTQEDLVTLTFDAANVVDNAYYTFEFPPPATRPGARSTSAWKHRRPRRATPSPYGAAQKTCTPTAKQSYRA